MGTLLERPTHQCERGTWRRGQPWYGNRTSWNKDARAKRTVWSGGLAGSVLVLSGLARRHVRDELVERTREEPLRVLDQETWRLLGRHSPANSAIVDFSDTFLVNRSLTVIIVAWLLALRHQLVFEDTRDGYGIRHCRDNRHDVVDAANVDSLQ